MGALHDGLRAIEGGLKPSERVIVGGLQQVRPGVTVEPKLVAMPTSESGARAEGPVSPPEPGRVARRSAAAEEGGRR